MARHLRAVREDCGIYPPASKEEGLKDNNMHKSPSKTSMIEMYILGALQK